MTGTKTCSKEWISRQPPFKMLQILLKLDKRDAKKPGSQKKKVGDLQELTPQTGPLV